MAWVIWHDDEKLGHVYVRRITPNFVSFTVNWDDARKFASRSEARAALKGTGLTAEKVGAADNGQDEPVGRQTAPADPPADPPADDGPPFT